MNPFHFGGSSFLNLSPESYTFPKGMITVPPSGAVAYLDDQGAVVVDSGEISIGEIGTKFPGIIILVSQEVFDALPPIIKHASVLRIPGKPVPQIVGYIVSLIAQRTPGVPEHGVHTFVEGRFQTLPKGLELGDSDVSATVAVIDEFILHNMECLYRTPEDDGDLIAACNLTHPMNFVPSGSAIKQFFRVEGVMSV